MQPTGPAVGAFIGEQRADVASALLQRSELLGCEVTEQHRHEVLVLGCPGPSSMTTAWVASNLVVTDRSRWPADNVTASQDISSTLQIDPSNHT
jgi:hypothetical protein